MIQKRSYLIQTKINLFGSQMVMSLTKQKLICSAARWLWVSHEFKRQRRRERKRERHFPSGQCRDYRARWKIL